MDRVHSPVVGTLSDAAVIFDKTRAGLAVSRRCDLASAKRQASCGYFFIFPAILAVSQPPQQTGV
jgi:hypothetical protein